LRAPYRQPSLAKRTWISLDIRRGATDIVIHSVKNKCKEQGDFQKEYEYQASQPSLILSKKHLKGLSHEIDFKILTKI
jgi:hypothetical protein